MGEFAKLTFALFLTWGVTACSTETDAFYVENASAQDLQSHTATKDRDAAKWGYEITLRIGLSGHRITSGNGTVIAYRSQSHVLISRDSLTYEKLTIFLGNQLVGDSGVLEIGGTSSAIAFWSVGDAMFGSQSDCVGWATTGEVKYEILSPDKIDVETWANFRPVSLDRHLKSHCRKFNFRNHAILERKDVLSLTPWDGRSSKNISDEAIRN